MKSTHWNQRTQCTVKCLSFLSKWAIKYVQLSSRAEQELHNKQISEQCSVREWKSKFLELSFPILVPSCGLSLGSYDWLFHFPRLASLFLLAFWLALLAFLLANLSFSRTLSRSQFWSKPGILYDLNLCVTDRRKDIRTDRQSEIASKNPLRVKPWG